jgi:hypothetical protein
MSDDDDNVSNFNPQLARMRRKNGHEPAYLRAPKQEKATTKRLGGRAIPASGARFRKADTEVPNVVRIECKATKHNSFSVTKAMMQTVEEAGLLEGQIPAIQIEFVDGKGNVEYSCYVVKTRDMEHVLGRLADAEGIAAPDKRDQRCVEHHGGKLTKSKRARGVLDTRKRRLGDKRP